MGKKKVKETVSYFTTFDNDIYEGIILNSEYFDLIKDSEKRSTMIDYVFEFGESFIVEQMLKGVNVEKEHTDVFEIALKIAVDHLVESPFYYIELEKMEKKLSLMEQVSLEEGFDFNKYFDPMFGNTDDYYKSPSHVFLYPDSVKVFMKDFSCSWFMDSLEDSWGKIKGYKDFCLVILEVDKKTNNCTLYVKDHVESRSPILAKNEGNTSLPVSVLFYLVDSVLMFPSDYFVVS
jgi:hypothetical protein